MRIIVVTTGHGVAARRGGGVIATVGWIRLRCH
jgi:hypothetical protein